jgi:hypothetical protein
VYEHWFDLDFLGVEAMPEACRDVLPIGIAAPPGRGIIRPLGRAERDVIVVMCVGV